MNDPDNNDKDDFGKMLSKVEKMKNMVLPKDIWFDKRYIRKFIARRSTLKTFLSPIFDNIGRTQFIKEREKRITKFLEDFEKFTDHSIPNIAFFDENCLFATCGFQEKYLNTSILEENSGRLYRIGTDLEDIITQVFGVPHLETDEKKQKLLEVIKTLPLRQTEIERLEVTLKREVLNIETCIKELRPLHLIFTPVYEMGFLLIFVDKKENLAFVRMNLPRLKERISRDYQIH